MKKQTIILLLTLFCYQISIAQIDSLTYGLKGKTIRALGKSSTSSSTFYAGLKDDHFGTGLIYKSADFGKTWYPLNNGQSIDPYVSDIQAIAESNLPSKTLFAGTWKNGLFKSEDDGISWKKDINFPTCDVRSIKMGIQNPMLIYAATSKFGIVKSTNGGKTWIRCEPQIIDTTFQFVWSVDIDPKNDNIVYAQTFDKGVWKSIDQGKTWKQILDTEGKVSWDIKISENSNEIWVASSKRGDKSSSIYHSVDRGNTWKDISEVPQIGVNQINIVESGDKKVLVIGSWKDGIYILDDNKWTKNSSVDFTTISEILTNNSNLLIGSWGNGIYHIKL